MTGSRDHQVRFGEAPGQPVGGLQGGQRVGVPAARQLQQPADRADNQPHCGISFGPEDTLGALHPGFCLLQPSLPGQHAPTFILAKPAAGSSAQPCRSASSAACLLRSIDRANDRKNSLFAA
jgi:hypothetical protein